MVDYTDFKCLDLTRNQIKEIVKDFRNRYCQNYDFPLDIEMIIENELDLSIEPIYSMWKTLEIDAFISSDLKCIFVDKDQYMDERNRYANRLRFSFSHEIGHLVLHKNIIANFSFATPSEYYEFNENIPLDEHTAFERQANEFAGNLLVPDELLKIEIGKVIEIINAQPKITELMRSDPSIVLDRILPTLRKPFEVSEDVIKIRVEKEGLWPPKLDI